MTTDLTQSLRCSRFWIFYDPYIGKKDHGTIVNPLTRSKNTPYSTFYCSIIFITTHLSFTLLVEPLYIISSLSSMICSPHCDVPAVKLALSFRLSVCMLPLCSLYTLCECSPDPVLADSPCQLERFQFQQQFFSLLFDIYFTGFSGRLVRA